MKRDGQVAARLAPARRRGFDVLRDQDPAYRTRADGSKHAKLWSGSSCRIMAPQTSNSESLTPLERAVLTTVLYGDLFDHPLTVDEVHRYLGVACPDRRALERAIEALDGRTLGTADGFVFGRGREATIDVRRRRRRLAAERWGPARRFARWLGWVPFLRMVAVCGSQAVDNGDDDGDVDLFLITVPGRLWLV